MTNLPTEKVTRVEVIDHRKNAPKFGRALTIWDENIIVEVDMQDNERTLKIFINDKP